ncbi:T complex protein 1 subunit beta [Encephalitozoon intestinalis ATCC 50506]|uniref:CCT-beta n=1 Tax=Encephalitozoon intestinalis (strain ATCC 50506) TaxID=876142 RepID=E0S9B4_ENCIT|nr:T complex protein 1 subunit beta [Encephalitozoon intestinalis ATCC 50506]ADM12178.1 T complex protein 1 subunit beta [Encephalitozoon intestinalis ATCC 50506]UTX45982.1 T complex protein 1 delta subunit [Encephalitozoon intestinalis]
MNIFSHANLGTTEEKGDDAKRTILAGTDIVGDILKTTLGPKGMLKMLKGQSVHVTNDGAFILKNLMIDSPSARILINSSTGQDWEEGDGTTSVAILASLLVKEASKLEMHPTKILKGYRMAQARCSEVLKRISFNPSKEDLVKLARTTLCSKVLKYDLEKFCNICVNAIENLGGRNDLNLVQVIKCSGKLEDSYLDDGFLLKKDVRIEEVNDPKILIANTSMDQDKIKIFGAKINVSSVGELEEMEKVEKGKIQEKVERISQNGINMFINRQLIYDYPLQLLKIKGIQAIEHADFDGVERLSNVLGGKILSTFDSMDETCYGTCKNVKNVYIGNERAIKFSGVKSGASTIVLCGSSKEMLDEAERSVHDALCVLSKIKQDPRVVYGGGSSEMAMAVDLNTYAMEVPGIESEAILAFSNALQQIPKILADNGGYDGEGIRASLRAEHNSGKTSYGVNVRSGSVGCMKESGVVDSFRIKHRVVTAASEAAQMIIKCDAIVKCKPRERTRE